MGQNKRPHIRSLPLVFPGVVAGDASIRVQFQRHLRVIVGAGGDIVRSAADTHTAPFPGVDSLSARSFKAPRPSGASEAFQSSDHVAVLNAIYDAVGVRICSLPATPDKILSGIRRKEEGIPENSFRYYLGGDFYETMDEIRENPVK